MPNDKPLPARDFVRLWNASETFAEACEKTGLSPASCYRQWYRYRDAVRMRELLPRRGKTRQFLAAEFGTPDDDK